MNLQEIRKTSLETAAKLGYETNHNLPLLEFYTCRNASEIIDRLLGMHCLAACAYGFDRERAWEWLSREVGGSVLTKEETTFLKLGSGNKQLYMTQIEGMWALAWAVGVVDILDFGHSCSLRFATMLPDLKKDESGAGIRSKARVRSLAELASACDLAYCLHWAK
jgi:hypothetical protein